MKLRCFECGNYSDDYVLQKEKRKYKGDGFNFELTVNTPHCKKCGALLDDKKLEKEIRQKAHNIIVQQRKKKENSLIERKEFV